MARTRDRQMFNGMNSQASAGARLSSQSKTLSFGMGKFIGGTDGHALTKQLLEESVHQFGRGVNAL